VAAAACDSELPAAAAADDDDADEMH